MPTLPPVDPSPASLQREIEVLKREIRLLKEHPREEDNPGQRRREIIFSIGAAVPVGVSIPYRVKDFSGSIHRLDIDIGTAGAGQSAYQINVNGASRYAGTVAGGQTDESVEDLNIEVEEWDKIAVEWTAVDAALIGCAMMLHLIVVDGDGLE